MPRPESFSFRSVADCKTTPDAKHDRVTSTLPGGGKKRDPGNAVGHVRRFELQDRTAVHCGKFD